MIKAITEAEYLTCLEFVYKADSSMKKGGIDLENRIGKMVLDTPDETVRKLRLLRHILGYEHLFCTGGKMAIEDCSTGRVHDAFRNSYVNCKNKLVQYKQRDFFVADAASLQKGQGYAVTPEGDIVPRDDVE